MMTKKVRCHRRSVGTSLVTGASLVTSPPETFQLLVEKGESNANLSTLKTLHASFMGGCYVGMSGLLSLIIAGNVATGNMVARTAIFAALFPVNLLLVLQTGGQLFTGNTATLSMALYERKITRAQLLKSWITSYLGNTLGCCTLVLVAWYIGVFQAGTSEMAARVAMKKCSATFGQTIVKAIMCNWLVCMAVWLATSAQDLASKMVGIWFPISMFIAIGFEHSVANMFMLPAGLVSGAPLSISDALLRNLIPVTIGNATAGAIVIAAGFSFAFGRLGSGKKGSFNGIVELRRRLLAWKKVYIGTDAA